LLTLVFVKIAADLSLYYTFAGFIAAMLGAEPAMLVVAMLLQSVCFAISYLLRRHGALRLAPVAIAGLPALLPGLGIAGAVVCVPAWAYAIFLAGKRIYEPDWSQQTTIFSVFWKVLVALCALAMIFGQSAAVRSAVLPFGFITLVGSVLLMRSLRHDAAVYCSAKYQVMNLVIIAALVAFSFFLSSDLFLSFCGSILKTVYNGVFGPILTAIVYLFTYIARLLAYIFSAIRFREKITLSEALDMQLDTTEDSIVGSETSSLTRIIAAVIAGVVALVVIFIVFRALARRLKPSQSGSASADSRENVSPIRQRSFAPAAGSPEAKVRAPYKKFLRLFSQRVSAPEASDTSMDIDRKGAPYFDKDASRELRRVYISARYGETATAQDAKYAKELYTALKKEK
jgi:hypothetical protein